MISRLRKRMNHFEEEGNQLLCVFTFQYFCLISCLINTVFSVFLKYGSLWNKTSELSDFESRLSHTSTDQKILCNKINIVHLRSTNRIVCSLKK